jgi:hypothetical protein
VVPSPVSLVDETLDAVPRRGRDLGWALCLGLALLAYVPLVSAWGTTDGDAAKIAWAIVRGIQTGQGIHIETLVYGPMKNMGYYAMFFWFYPSRLDLAHVMTVMNWLNVVSLSIVAVAWYFAVRRFLGGDAARIAGPVFVFVPIVWDLSGYGHPLGPSLALLFLGWLSVLRSLSKTKLAVTLWLGGIALLSTSAWVRGEALLAFPMVIVSALLAAPRERAYRSAILATVACAGAASLYFMVNRLTAGGIASRPGHSSFSAYILSYWYKAGDLAAVPRGFIYWAIGLGPLLALLAVVGLLVAVARRDWRVLTVALASILPAAFFFLPDPERPRHFMMTVPGVTVLATYPFWRLDGRHRALVTAALVLANYAAGAAAYPLIATRYNWYYAHHYGKPISLEVPLGGMIDRRMSANRLLAVISEQAQRIVQIKDVPVFAIGDRAAVRLAYQLAVENPLATWSTQTIDGIEVTRISRPGSRPLAFLIRGYSDVNRLLRTVARSADFRDFRFYEFPVDEVRERPLAFPRDLLRLER